VGAGDHEALPLAEEHRLERARHRRVGDASIDGRARFDVVLATDVADDHEIGPIGEVRGVEAGLGLDAVACEGVAHGRIERHVAPGDPMPHGLQEAREGAHAGAGHADQVNMHPSACSSEAGSGRRALRIGGPETSCAQKHCTVAA
jgi:hypothetical protein